MIDCIPTRPKLGNQTGVLLSTTGTVTRTRVTLLKCDQAFRAFPVNASTVTGGQLREVSSMERNQLQLWIDYIRSQALHGARELPICSIDAANLRRFLLE